MNKYILAMALLFIFAAPSLSFAHEDEGEPAPLHNEAGKGDVKSHSKEMRKHRKDGHEEMNEHHHDGDHEAQNHGNNSAAPGLENKANRGNPGFTGRGNGPMGHHKKH